MPKEIDPWAMYPRKTSTASLPEALKMEVTAKANELIETVLRPKYIQAPPENPQFNYIVDIYGQWIQLYTGLTVDECIETVRDDPYFAAL